VIVSILVLGGIGCTDNANPTTTPAMTTLPTNTAPSAAPPAPSGTPTAAAPTTTPGPTTETAVEAGGWRLVVTRPVAGTDVGRMVTICYRASGTARESSVELDVSLVEPGSTAAGPATRLLASVGAGSVDLDLTSVPLGRYDLRIGLVGDGQVIGGAVVTIAGITVSDTDVTMACP
jgi:hypothetical protein